MSSNDPLQTESITRFHHWFEWSIFKENTKQLDGFDFCIKQSICFWSHSWSSFSNSSTSLSEAPISEVICHHYLKFASTSLSQLHLLHLSLQPFLILIFFNLLTVNNQFCQSPWLPKSSSLPCFLQQESLIQKVQTLLLLLSLMVWLHQSFSWTDNVCMSIQGYLSASLFLSLSDKCH